MKSYVLTLDRAVERKERAQKIFQRFDIEFEFFSGVDWRNLTRENIVENVHPKYLKKSKKTSKSVRGILACWISHRNIWKTAVANDEKMIAVFEDDATLTSDTKAALVALQKSEIKFDIVFMYNGKDTKPLIPAYKIDDGRTLNLIRYDSIGAVGYVITQKAMATLLERYPLMVVHIDALMHYYWWTGLKTYILTPQVVFHGEPNQVHFSYCQEPNGGGYFIEPKKKITRVERIKLELKKIPKTVSKGVISKVLVFRRRMKMEVTDSV